MLSFRGRMVKFLFRYGHMLKGKWKRPPFDATLEGIEKFRANVETAGERFGKFPDDLNVESIKIDNMYAEWIEPANTTKDKVILYFHGGMYLCGSPQAHRNHVAKFVKGLNIPALVFDYRLAPENPFPAALDDAVSAYEYLLQQGINAENIIWIGDSAGGGLCLATLLAVKDKSIDLPFCAVAMSPWTDLTLSGETHNTKKNVCLSPIGCAEAASLAYIGDNEAGNPYISPLWGDLSNLPPLYINVGSEETLTDDSIRFAEKAEQNGVDVTLSVGKGLFHCYPLCTPMFPEATEEINNIFNFIRSKIN